MKALVLAGLLILLSVISFGQENLLTWNEQKPLSWDDFIGKAADNSDFDAESFGDVKYTYKFTSLKEFEFDVQATFDRNASWIKKQSMSPKLLKHEQVHFDIAQLYACKLKLAFESFDYTQNFKQEIEHIATEMSLEYHKMQELYDEQTNHSTIAAKQKRWEVLVKEQLNEVNCNQIKFTASKASPGQQVGAGNVTSK